MIQALESGAPQRSLASRRRLSHVLVPCALLAACATAEPHATADEIARAKRVYTDCVENEIGIEVESLDIRANGDITVEFGDGYTEQGAARALSICEPRIASVLEPGGASVLGPPPNLGRPGSDADVEALLSERAALGFQGAVIAEVAGERRVSVGFGTLTPAVTPAATPEVARTPDTDTAFDCGSIMKDVTAASIFLLEEDGLLSREQSLAEFFEDVPSVWAEVTLDQVLSHSAGFGEYHDTEGDFEPMDRATALERIFAQEPLFEPGTDSAYSNSGYTLLAVLIEVVTGGDYLAFTHQRVFEPLAMTRSGFYAEPLWQDGNVAIGSGADRFLENDPTRWPAPTWALIGNGGLVSTPEDLLKLAKALDGEGLFQPATLDAYRQAQSGGSIAGKPIFGYAGGNDFGFNAVIAGVPTDATYVVAASHVLSPVTAEILGVELVQVLFGDVIELPEGD
jgi:CubicO group peptidase (beta-lactamase class C family)